MKQPKTITDLSDLLDREMAWRIRELHELRSVVRSAGGINVNTHIRAGVAMLYAHWEGFVKTSANAYVGYLAHRADLNRDMLPCFVALGMKTKIAGSNQSSKALVAVNFVNFFLEEIDKPIKLPKSDAIKAESNLSSDVFLNITNWIGIDSTRYETRFNLIDQALLGSRNKIAHGEYLEIDADRFGDLSDNVLEMLRWFKTDIENAVVTKAFLKNTSTAVVAS